MAASSRNVGKTESAVRFKARLAPQTLKTNNHPLHIFISRKGASKLNIPADEQKCYLSMWTNTQEDPGSVNSRPPGQGGSVFQRLLSKSHNFPEILIPDNDDSDVDAQENLIGLDIEIFTYVWITEELDESVDAQHDVVLKCSDQFGTHYNIRGDTVYVRPVHVYPVSSIVIGVSSAEAFHWMKEKNFCHTLLSEICSNTVLVRSKDVFLAPYGRFLEDPNFKRSFYFDIYVLESSPVEQGLISVKTEIVLTYMGDFAAERQQFLSQIETIVSSRGGDKSIFGPFHNSKDLTYAMNQCITPEVVDEADITSFRSKAKAMERRRQKHSENFGSFQFEVISQQHLFKRMLWRDERRLTFDSLYFIGMSRKQMLKLGLYDGSCVWLTPEYIMEDYDDVQMVKVERLCMVRCLGKEYDRCKRLFISPLCLFNMMRKPPIEKPASVIMKRYIMPDEDSTDYKSTNTRIPVPVEVHISIIPSPNYSPRAPHDEALKQYFSCPRIVAHGDVIAIRSSDDPMFWQNTGDDTENRFPCIYFKVILIKGSRAQNGIYQMDNYNTSLIQIGTEHSYVPAMMQTYLSTNTPGFWDRDSLPGLDSSVEKLESFILPHLTTKHSNKSLSSVPPAVLVAGAVGSGKTTLTVAVARRLGIHAFKINCHSLAGESSGSTEARMKNAFNAAALYSPCILLLQSIHALGRDRDGNTEDPRVASSFLANVMQLKNDLQQYPMVVVATTHSTRHLTPDMLDCFLHQVELEVPNEMERCETIDAMLQTVSYSGNLSIPYIAQRTAGFVLGDLAALVAHAKREAFKRTVQLCCAGRVRPTLQEEEDLVAAGLMVQQRDFHTALDQLQAAHSDAIGAPKIPSVHWDDIGGLEEVKSEILDTIQLPLQYPELLAAGLRRSGVLLYGPPGTGKTLLAKAVATECSLNFLSVKGPELINMYVGQSEENVREVFRRARSATPCVIFFDELDSLAPNRGKSGDSGGVMDRVVSQLLAELDGLNKACDVFVIGATNRPDLLDPALIRPGRFDKLLYLGVNTDHDSQLKVLTAQTRKFNLEPDFSMESFIQQCPSNLTGADFYALASDAMLNAVKRKIKQLEEGTTTDQSVVVSEEDFRTALENLSPSVTAQELLRYEQLRGQFDVQT